MDIKVLKVYRNTNGVQVFVDVCANDTQIETYSIPDFISRVRSSTDCNMVNFSIIENKYLKGKGCSLEFVEVLSRMEMIHRYPDKWLAVKPYFSRSGSSLDMDFGVVDQVLTCAGYNKFRMSILKSGKDAEYYYFKTTPSPYSR